jgi:hypothetical protein
MQWSKRKKRAESFFAESVQGRLELRSTHYRGTHDEEGRGYITLIRKKYGVCAHFPSIR